MTTPEEHRIKKAKAAVDRRLLLLYVVLIALLVAFIAYTSYDRAQTDKARSKFEQAIITNCETSRANTMAFNDLLNQLISAVAANKDYTPAEKAERIDFYKSGLQTVPECPPLQKGN